MIGEYKIALVSMPFASLSYPSIALTQLRSVIAEKSPTVSTRVVYLSHEFGAMLGPRMYENLAHGHASHVTAFGEWLFRQVAFPELPDNTDEYMRRFASHFEKEFLQDLVSKILPLRSQLAITLDQLIAKHALAEADLVGLTSMFQQNLASFALARRLKLARPSQVIVMGGANCEGTMGIEIVQHVDCIDFVFSGHSLVSFPEFVHHTINGAAEKCHHIHGVFSRDNSLSIDDVVDREGVPPDWGTWQPAKQLRGIQGMGAERDINAEVALDYDDFLDSFESKVATDPDGREPDIMFETSRGCWWGERAHCTFCGLNGQSMSYRAMDPQRALKMIEGLIARYGERVSRLFCCDNILPREYFEGVFRKLRPPEHISLFYEVKADLSEEEVGLLAAARVLEIQPGIEALATSTLKIMRKGTTAFNNVRLLQHCRTHGIRPGWNLLVGFPGESEEVYERYVKIIPSLFHLPPPVGVFPIRFDRFSPYFHNAKRYELTLTPYESYEFLYPFSRNVLMNMSYYFRDANLNASYAESVAKWLTPMRNAVSRWNTLWTPGKAYPKLSYRKSDTGSLIEDERTGRPITQRISAAEAAILESIREPVRSEQLQADLVARLRAMKLTFEERDRVMSLV